MSDFLAGGFRMSENAKKRAETKKRLKDALMALYAQYDFQSITVTMVCREAGLHRSTFYLYYNSIDEVLREIEHEILEEIQNFADKINLFDTRDSSLSTSEIFAKNEPYMVDYYKWQYSIREYLNPLLGSYGDPYFIQRYEQIVYDNTLPTLDFLGYKYVDNDYAVRFLTGGVIKTNQEWLLNGDISAEKLVRIQRSMLVENPLLKGEIEL